MRFFRPRHLDKILIIATIVLCSASAWAETSCRTWSFGNIEVTCLELGNDIANCYVVTSKQRDAYIIDPGGNASDIITYLKKHQLKVLGYLLTHAHNDHIGALEQLVREIPSHAGIHKLDRPLYLKRMGDNGPFDMVFEEGRSYGPDYFSFTVIHTPGHSPGSVSFHFNQADLLFTGDTLFKDGVGRTDFTGGSQEDLFSSLSKLKRLQPRTMIFPGHGDVTMLHEELPQ